jgi:ATP-dependent Clp protease adaptor protein ClpS
MAPAIGWLIPGAGHLLQGQFRKGLLFFVVLVLMKFFHKSETEATHIMLSVHHKGHGVAGLYTKDVAETKVAQVQEYAKEHGMPLRLTVEPE